MFTSYKRLVDSTVGISYHKREIFFYLSYTNVNFS